MNRFRQDNTEGYSDADLVDLNVAWDRIMEAYDPGDEPDESWRSMTDHWSELLLARYDAGERGDILVYGQP